MNQEKSEAVVASPSNQFEYAAVFELVRLNPDGPIFQILPIELGTIHPMDDGQYAQVINGQTVAILEAQDLLIIPRPQYLNPAK